VGRREGGAEPAQARRQLRGGQGRLEDAFALLEVDTSLDHDQERRTIIAMVNGPILGVVYTERRERTRLDCARMATRREEYEYHQNKTPD
jgi:uncharacterized DUF497 family protein